MEFSIGRLHVKLEARLKPVGNPFKMSKWAKQCLAKRILAEVTREGKFERIKVLRKISIGEGWYDIHNFGLKASKDWVEEVFADNGAGEIAL